MKLLYERIKPLWSAEKLQKFLESRFDMRESGDFSKIKREKKKTMVEQLGEDDGTDDINQ